MNLPIPSRILNRVARSFAISLKILPRQVRPPITLAYLLARISDIEADGPSHKEDLILLSIKSHLLKHLQASPDRDLIEAVWSTIRQGQQFDRTRFPSPLPLSPAELDQYTFLVAGCVGIFWTQLCSRHIQKFSNLQLPHLEKLGASYGKALQLVNILRDRHRDENAGRIYLTAPQIPKAIISARQGLNDGILYSLSIRIRRLRAATILPALIADKTLNLIEKNPNHPMPKIPKSQVYILTLQALLTSTR